MKAAQKQTQVVEIANDSNPHNSDNDQTELLDTVKEIFSTQDRTILTKFLSEIREVLGNDRELADYVNQQRDKLGNTALHTCFMMYEQEMGRIEGVFEQTRDIIHSKTDQEDLGEQYSEVVVFAAMTKHSLIAAGLDPNIRNLQGRTAIELVSSQNMKFFLKADSVVTEDMQQSLASASTIVPPSHVSRLDNAPKRKGGCIIL